MVVLVLARPSRFPVDLPGFQNLEGLGSTRTFRFLKRPSRFLKPGRSGEHQDLSVFKKTFQVPKTWKVWGAPGPFGFSKDLPGS